MSKKKHHDGTLLPGPYARIFFLPVIMIRHPVYWGLFKLRGCTFLKALVLSGSLFIVSMNLQCCLYASPLLFVDLFYYETWLLLLYRSMKWVKYFVYFGDYTQCTKLQPFFWDTGFNVETFSHQKRQNL